MLILRNRFLQQVGRTIFQPSLTAARQAHTKLPPHTKLPTSGAITQPISTDVDEQASSSSKCLQGEKACEYPDAHVTNSDSKCAKSKFDITPIKSETLATTIAARIGIPYLSNATEAEAKDVPRDCTGYIYGAQKGQIVPFAVSYRGEARWLFFLVLERYLNTYISTQASQALSLEEEGVSMVTIGGRTCTVCRAAPDSPLSDMNILGTGFCREHNVVKFADYANGHVKLFFPT